MKNTKRFPLVILILLLAFGVFWVVRKNGSPAVVSGNLSESTRATVRNLIQDYRLRSEELSKDLTGFPTAVEEVEKRLAELRSTANVYAHLTVSGDRLASVPDHQEISADGSVSAPGAPPPVSDDNGLNPESADASAVYSDIPPAADAEEALQARELLLTNLTGVYSRYLSSLQNPAPREDGTAEQYALDRPPPYDMQTYDRHRERYLDAQNTLEAVILLMQSDSGNLQTAMDDVRKNRKELEDMRSGAVSGATPWDIETAEFRLELNQGRLAQSAAAFQTKIDRARAILSTLEDEEGRLNRIREGLGFSQEELEQILDALRDRITERRTTLIEAQKNLDKSKASLEKIDGLSSRDATAASSDVLYQESAASADSWEYRVELAQDELNWLIEAERLWRLRYAIFHDQAKGDELWSARNEAQARMTELRAYLGNIQREQTEFYARLARLRNGDIPVSGDLGGSLNNEIYDTLSGVFSRYTYLINSQSLLLRGIYEEAGAKINAARIIEKTAAYIKESAIAFVNTELWNEGGYSITVSKLAVALLIFVAGIVMSKNISRWLRRKVLRGMADNTETSIGLERILFYIIWFSFTLIALRVARIPLTAFAFIGGALGIGIAFGAQDLFNNLISGFIIMFYRPIKIGDIVEIDGMTGTVINIGSRVATMRTWENLDITIPNKNLLQNKVINWTGTDKKVCSKLEIVIDKKTSAREIEKMLLETAHKHPSILEYPESFVLLKNLETDKMTFELYFWLNLSDAPRTSVGTDMRRYFGERVASDLRYNIDQALAQEDISSVT